MILRILRRLLLPRWFTRRLGRGARWIAYRLTVLLTILVTCLLVFLLWRDATYTWPARRVARRVAAAAGRAEARDRDQLIAALREHGFATLHAGMPRDQVARVFAAADLHEELGRHREAFYFDFVGDHEFAFYLDYDTADCLKAVAWEWDFFRLGPRPPVPLPLQLAPGD